MNLVYSFSRLDYVIEKNDLQAMHLFTALIQKIANNSELPVFTTGYQMYYYCCIDLIEQRDENNLRLFLQTLSIETVKTVLNIVATHSLLSIAVLANKPNLVSILIEHGVDPTVLDEGENSYNALDWAIFNGNWTIMEMLVAVAPKPRVPAGNGYILWSKASEPRVSLSELTIAMQSLDVRLQFHQRLQQISALDMTLNNSQSLEVVHELIKIARNYFSNLEYSLDNKNKIFIQECIKALPTKFINSIDKTELNDLVNAIRELKNALSLASEPTSGCILS